METKDKAIKRYERPETFHKWRQYVHAQLSDAVRGWREKSARNNESTCVASEETVNEVSTNFILLKTAKYSFPQLNWQDLEQKQSESQHGRFYEVSMPAEGQEEASFQNFISLEVNHRPETILINLD